MSKKLTKKVGNKKKKNPQGRPRRTEPIKRLSSDLPADLYDMVKDEVKNELEIDGFTFKLKDVKDKSIILNVTK